MAILCVHCRDLLLLSSIPPTKLNKLVQYEISSSAVQANPSHAWVQTAWVHTKKERQSACLDFELISYGVSFYSFVSGNDDEFRLFHCQSFCVDSLQSGILLANRVCIAFFVLAHMAILI